MQNLKSITAIARRFGIAGKYLEVYGNYKAKISLGLIKAIRPKKGSKYIVVTGITPTHFGEGKTVTTIGLSMALNHHGKKAAACIRQPSLGPFFGVKGGGLGGGRAEAIPQEEISLNLTGDIHAVGQAHNLCAAFLDNHIFRGNRLRVDLDRIFWNRVLDVNDRSLRNIRIGIGGDEFGVERQTRFDITAASEIMAILALCESITDMRRRLANIVVALDRAGKPVRCEDLRCAGAMAAILTDAIKPNLVQTTENTPCLVHTGITHGNSSILADRIAMRFADYVVTEAGFGADCGAEKFFNIKCRQSGLMPDAAVLVASIRALKIHGGSFKMIVGRPLDKNIYKEDLNSLENGCSNLEKQIENIRAFGIPCVVAINRFTTDTDREIKLVRRIALEAGAIDCVTSDLYKRGSSGGEGLAKAVISAAGAGARGRFKFLYPLDLSIKEKIEIIAKKIYGASGVSYEAGVEQYIRIFERLGFSKLPIYMAKTHLSLSHDPKLKGRPKGFMLPISSIRPYIGAGFLYVICGGVLTMPSLPAHPVGEKIDIDSKGRMIYVP